VLAGASREVTCEFRRERDQFHGFVGHRVLLPPAN
jgi:hypothetical protein